MATRLVDSFGVMPELARPIGRTRPLAPAPTDDRTAPKAPPPASAPAPVVEARLSLAEVEVLVADRVAQASRKAAETATEKAYKEGFTAGAASVELSQRQWLEKLQTGIDQSLTQIDQKLAEIEHLSVKVACLTLERVLGCDEARSQLLQQIVRNQLSLLSDSSVLRVRLSERDLRACPELMGALEATYGARVQIVQDAQLTSGGCILELKLGQIDAGIDTHLDLIRAHFAKGLEKDGIA